MLVAGNRARNRPSVVVVPVIVPQPASPNVTHHEGHAQIYDLNDCVRRVEGNPLRRRLRTCRAMTPELREVSPSAHPFP